MDESSHIFDMVDGLRICIRIKIKMRKTHELDYCIVREIHIDWEDLVTKNRQLYISHAVYE